jgi:hypothetical protein
VAPRELLAELDGAEAAQLGLENPGLGGGREEQAAAGDALLQVWGQAGVVVAVEVVETKAAAGENVIPAICLERLLIHLLMQTS